MTQHLQQITDATYRWVTQNPTELVAHRTHAPRWQQADAAATAAAQAEARARAEQEEPSCAQ